MLVLGSVIPVHTLKPVPVLGTTETQDEEKHSAGRATAKSALSHGTKAQLCLSWPGDFGQVGSPAEDSVFFPVKWGGGRAFHINLLCEMSQCKQSAQNNSGHAGRAQLTLLFRVVTVDRS